MSDRLAAVGAFVMAAALVFAMLAVGYARYSECRAHGFSVFYCVTSK